LNEKKRQTVSLAARHMKSAKKNRLETKGWRVGTVAEFLQLSPEESAYIEIKLALSKNLQERRKDKSLTQEQLARLLKSSQSRVAKMEAGDRSVSLDLLVRSLLVLGESRKSLAKILSEPRSAFVS
jgi:DNA-binding XRE family transcriptional regulator